MDDDTEHFVKLTMKEAKQLLLYAAGLLAAAVFGSMGIGYLIGSGHLKLW